MKPINYKDTIDSPVYREYQWTPINKTVKLISKSRMENIKRWIHFWALMIGISDFKKPGGK